MKQIGDEKMKSAIKLFKAVPIANKNKISNDYIMKKTMGHGFIFTPEVLNNYSNIELEKLIKLVDEEYGMDGERANNTFHKSWEKVKNASMEQLVMEQIVHYITTYGFESLGIYDKDSVYIPSEKLEIPDLDVEGFNFIVIKGLTKPEFKEKLITFLQSGIALAEDTKKAVVDICLFVDITTDEIQQIKNKEVRVTLYDFLDKIPEEPIEFLRYAIYKSIGKTLLIKDKTTLEEIKSKENFDVLALFYKYRNNYGLEKLATIFYRFKPIFLAFKSDTNKQMNSYINKIRKLAKKYHKPMPSDYLNDITGMIKNGVSIDNELLNNKLSKANLFRRIRLAYALHYRTKENADSILYRIRNGKSYSTDFNFQQKEKADEALNIVLDSIIKDVSKNVFGKKIYIPDYITYTLPATEKQFTGNFPSGTCIKTTDDMLVGVHWANVEEQRVDLDLSLVSISEKIGWDSKYRNSDRSILFSGDLVDAPLPKGASELYYISGKDNDAYMMFLNYYNYNEDISVPFKIMVAKQEVNEFNENYTINPNNILSVSKTAIDKKQKALGFVVTDNDEYRFYFNELNIGESITSSEKPYVMDTIKYLTNYYTNMISLNDILSKAGAIIVTDKDKAEECDINLSPDNVDKEIIISLLKVKRNERK